MSTVNLGTASNAANWLITGAGATEAPAVQVGGPTGSAISITSNGFSAGTFLQGGSLSSFTGLWYADEQFTLPANATNVQLSFSGLLADDRAVLQLNGNDIGDVGISGFTGQPVTGPGLMQFPGSGDAPFTFDGTYSGTVTSFFNVGGTNDLRLVVNNTGDGLDASTHTFATTTDFTDAQVVATVTYQTSWNNLPNPLTWTGQGASANWNDPDNWNLGVVPANGDSLIFPASAAGVSNNNITGLALNAIDLQGGGFTLTGNAVTLSTGLGNEAGTNIDDLGMTLGTAWTPGTPLFTSSGEIDVLDGTLEFGGTVTVKTGSGLQVEPGGDLDIAPGGSLVQGPGGNVYMHGTATIDHGGAWAMKGLDCGGNDVAAILPGGAIDVLGTALATWNTRIDVLGTLEIGSTGSFQMGDPSTYNGDNGNALTVGSGGALDVDAGGEFAMKGWDSGGNDVAVVDSGGAFNDLGSALLGWNSNFNLQGTGTVGTGASLQVGDLGFTGYVTGDPGATFTVSSGAVLNVNSGGTIQTGMRGLDCGGQDITEVALGGTLNLSGTADVQNADTLEDDGTLDVTSAGSAATLLEGDAMPEPEPGGILHIEDTSKLVVGNTGFATVENLVLSDASTATVAGTLTVPAGGTVSVTDQARLNTQGTGVMNNLGTQLNWPAPVAIDAGTALGSTQLDATANVPGTFVYTLADGNTPASGAVLPVGTGQVLNVTFTPTNTAYSAIAASTTINVNVVSPTSSVNSLPAVTASSSFTVSWSGSPGTGASSIASYEIFVSVDGAAFQPFLTSTKATSATFSGQYGHTYAFFSVATDNLGDRQTTPSQPQATTMVAPLVTMTRLQDLLNRKKQVTEAIVTFSGPVNASQADVVGTYRLATPGKKRSYTAKNATVIKLKRAVYNAATDQVILTPKKPFALTKPVQLLVQGQPPAGLQDSLGRLIDGNHDNQPGGNAIAILGKKAVTIDASVADTRTAPLVSGAAIDALFERGEMPTK